MTIWIVLPTIVLFVLCFIKVTQDYIWTLSLEARRSRAQNLLAGPFIRNAIAQYELRHSLQSTISLSEHERLNDEADDLVEQYYLETNEPNYDTKKMAHLRVVG